MKVIESTYRLELRRILLNGLGVQDLPVVLAHVQVLVIVLGQENLLLVVAQLEVGDIIQRLDGRVVGAPVLLRLLTFLPLLLQLLRGLLRLPREVSCADLPAQDTGRGPVALFYAQRHLLKNEFGLLPTGHRTKGLDLQLAQDIASSLDVALLLLDVGKNAGDARALDFNEDLRAMSVEALQREQRKAHLALGDGSQSLDDGKLGVQVRDSVQEAHDNLDHLGNSLLELAMLLGEQKNLLVQLTPFSLILA